MYEYRAKCVNVVDGDTIDVLIDLGFKIKHEIRVRLMNVDTPEMKIEEQHEEAVRVKSIVEEDLLGKDIIITTEKENKSLSKSKDTYGRYLAVVKLEDGTNYNDSLLKRGLVKENSKWNKKIEFFD